MTQTSLATSADFEAILALQELNHLSTLPETSRDDGFLTTYLDIPKMEYLVARNGLFVAKIGAELAGFACSEAWDLSGERGFHNDVVALFPLHLNNREIDAQNSRLYGPVCVAARFRGQGVLSSLVEAVRAQFRAEFSFGLTFIDIRNPRSLAAHERKLGFRRVFELPCEDAIYHTLAFSLALSNQESASTSPSTSR